MTRATIKVWMTFSPRAREVVECQLTLPWGATVQDAISGCGHIPDSDPPIEWVPGVWGRKASLRQPLRDGDRVELYRPLRVDPKVARRQRFQRQGARAAGLFAKRRDGAKAGY